jgi:iron(II)-dependent oxidoreductase
MIPPDGKWDPYGARIRDNFNNPQRVGQKRPNAWGLYDMLGNVEEWVADWYDPKYFSNSPERNPQGPPTGTRAVTRGGNWRNTVREARLSFRTDNDPNQSLNAVGFRCVMD